MAVLFHDVGNIHGRDNHQNNVAEIFEEARQGATYDRKERRVILDAIKAHTGRSLAGDKDTLKSLDDVGRYFLDGNTSPRKVAATLRMADELAEMSRSRTPTLFFGGLPPNLPLDRIMQCGSNIDGPPRRGPKDA